MMAAQTGGGAAGAPVVHLPWGDADEAGEGGLRDIRACQQGGEGDAGEGAHGASIDQHSLRT